MGHISIRDEYLIVILAELKFNAVGIRSQRNQIVHFFIKSTLITNKNDSSVCDIKDASNGFVLNIVYNIRFTTAKIYASSFFYNERGVAVWPAQVINYTNKTQFLFRIEKGVLDINDPGVNDYFPPEEMRVPFRNMVYIGDSDTDIPCMKLVNSSGGHSIGVYDPDTQEKTKVKKMIQNNRIKYYAPADYTEGSELDRLVKAIVDKTATYEVLENQHFRDVAEARK